MILITIWCTDNNGSKVWWKHVPMQWWWSVQNCKKWRDAVKARGFCSQAKTEIQINKKGANKCRTARSVVCLVDCVRVVRGVRKQQDNGRELTRVLPCEASSHKAIQLMRVINPLLFTMTFMGLCNHNHASICIVLCEWHKTLNRLSACLMEVHVWWIGDKW